MFHFCSYFVPVLFATVAGFSPVHGGGFRVLRLGFEGHLTLLRPCFGGGFSHASLTVRDRKNANICMHFVPILSLCCGGIQGHFSALCPRFDRASANP